MRDGVVFRPEKEDSDMGVEPGASLFEWRDPKPGQKAGFGKWKNPKSPL